VNRAIEYGYSTARDRVAAGRKWLMDEFEIGIQSWQRNKGNHAKMAEVNGRSSPD